MSEKSLAAPLFSNMSQNILEKSSQYTLDRLPNHVSIVVVVVGFKDIDNTPVAVGLEEFLYGDKESLKSVSPVLYQKISNIISYFS